MSSSVRGGRERRLSAADGDKPTGGDGSGGQPTGSGRQPARGRQATGSGSRSRSADAGKQATAGGARKPGRVPAQDGKVPAQDGKVPAQDGKVPAQGGKPDGRDTGGKAGGGRPGGGKPGGSGKPGASGKLGGGGRPKGVGKPGGGGPRRPAAATAPGGRNWGFISLIAVVVLIAAGIVGYGAWTVGKGEHTWQERADAISGLVNYRNKDPKMLEYEKHTQGPIAYRVSPAVGGVHNNDWQNCMGDIYDAPIAQEHAVHSLEHGAIWITYRPDLPKDQVETLADKVRGREKMLMSPFKDLDSPISLQAWGYQLKVPDADDKRIDEFISALRVNASREGANASCSQGITATGDHPRDLPQQPQQPAMQPQ